jgi:acetylornithine deacetylase/succinyl-diaminopimelate desuccinylase-like protein
VSRSRHGPTLPAGRAGTARAAIHFAIALALVAAILSTGCRKAESAQQDPFAREAEDAFVAYLQIDTTNPPGNETRGAEFLRDLFAKDGIETRLLGADPARQGLYARLESGSNEKALLLLSHIDVVPVEEERWTHPPFGGVRAGGYIWGRGALDAKSLTIAQAMALLDLKRRNARLERDVVFLAVPDEELGGMNGAKQILESYPELFANVGFVLNEGGSNETAVDRVMYWGIEVQQKIPLWLRIVSEGTGGHGSSPASEGGASAKLVRALAAIDALETPYRLTETVERIAAATAAVRPHGRGAKLRLIREPLDVPMIERELSPFYLNLLRDTIAITTLSAGRSVNVIPSRATADIDIRLLPGTAPDAMLARIREAVGDYASVEVILSGEPAPDSPMEGKLFETVAKAMRESSPGSIVGPMITAGTTDSRFFRARGIVAYGIAPFKVNYYDAGTVHGDDERIRARFFEEGVRLTRRIVSDFCEAKSDS